ncbi:neutrophil antibiotic peptide NP-3A-like [Suncus etruscus]|uniref:neutrophil antibiotic peptide NP-3A-like n=1 Tax=Suncus etruscus TaxID=109475 RepID=UPI00210F3AB9|nr:neutrophil antibiotic peptide NP-3A-like [Suncus etruscus]
MKTLSLLAALLVLGLPGQAEPLGRNTEWVTGPVEPTALTAKQDYLTQDQGPLRDELDQPEDEDEDEGQDMAMSFYGDQGLSREAAEARGLVVCSCRRFFCKLFERRRGTCRQNFKTYKLCCVKV